MIIKLIEHNPKISITVIAIIMFALNMDVLEVTIMEARNFITARENIVELLRSKGNLLKIDDHSAKV